MAIQNIGTLTGNDPENPDEEEVAPEVPLDPETPVETPSTAPGPEGPRPATEEPPNPGHGDQDEIEDDVPSNEES